MRPSPGCHPMSPGSACVDSQAGVPPGVYNMVMGDGPNCGEAKIGEGSGFGLESVRDIFFYTWHGQTMIIADLFTQNLLHC